MSRSAKLRLLFLGAAVIMLAVLLGGAAWLVGNEFGELRRQFNRVQLESFRIADHLVSWVERLDAQLLAFEASGEEKPRRQFEKESEALDKWIDQERSHLQTAEERRLLDAINTEYDDYLAEAHRLIATRKPDETDAATSARIARIQAATQKLIKLGAELGNAHRAELGRLVISFEHGLDLLKAFTATGLVLLVVFGTLGLRALYRELVAPLRTQLVESRALLERQEKLASLGVLAAGVAHEIRNPLTAIKARLFTQQKTLEKGSPAYQDSDLIGREITRLERIVRDFLHFASPSEPDWAPVSARDLLVEARELLASELAKKEIALTVDDGPDFTVLADAQQLKQVLINLVQNSAESIGEQGHVTLRARRGRRPLEGRPGDVVILEVSDDGNGIPPEVRARLFDPFYTTKPTGTGLGLSIAMRILEKHRGTLQFQTEPGRGTTFGLILPLNS